MSDYTYTCTTCRSKVPMLEPCPTCNDIRTLYAAPSFQKWDSLKGPEDIPLAIQGTRATGYLLVYESSEDFYADFPDMEPMTLRYYGSEAEQ